MRIKLILVVVLIAILIACTTEDDGIYFTEVNKITETNIDYSPLELEILELVNNYRNSIGLSELKTSEFISSVAQTHSNFMMETGIVDHTNFTFRNEKLSNELGAKRVGENIAVGYKTAQSVVNAWLKSEKHKKIIETEEYTHFGISIQKNNDGQNYFTQMFIQQ